MGNREAENGLINYDELMCMPTSMIGKFFENFCQWHGFESFVSHTHHERIMTSCLSKCGTRNAMLIVKLESTQTQDGGELC